MVVVGGMKAVMRNIRNPSPPMSQMLSKYVPVPFSYQVPSQRSCSEYAG